MVFPLRPTCSLHGPGGRQGSRGGSQPPVPALLTAWQLSRIYLFDSHRTSICFYLTPRMPSYAGQVCLCRGLSVENWVGAWDSRTNCISVNEGQQGLRPVSTTGGQGWKQLLIGGGEHLTETKMRCFYLFTPFPRIMYAKSQARLFCQYSGKIKRTFL